MYVLHLQPSEWFVPATEPVDGHRPLLSIVIPKDCCVSLYTFWTTEIWFPEMFLSDKTCKYTDCSKLHFNCHFSMLFNIRNEVICSVWLACWGTCTNLSSMHVLCDFSLQHIVHCQVLYVHWGSCRFNDIHRTTGQHCAIITSMEDLLNSSARSRFI